ncbi:MAG TPA: tetratricopeptide repeat protein [Kofleriaceae bacterium]|nr:tetratricopeptide repeat protein [Kofleriaceae bacterium]
MVVRGRDVSNTLADSSRAGSLAPRLGFSFRLAGGSGRLTLDERTFFGWLRLERLELEVPDLRLPVDLAVGPEAFQRHRTRARHADLRMEQADLDRFVARHAHALGDLGVEELRVLACDGHLNLGARVREAGQAAELTARVYLEAAQGRLRFACGRSLTYGYLPTPAPLAAHRIMTALLGGRDDPRAPEGTGSGATTGRHEIDRTAMGPWASAVRGLGDIDIDPLAMALWHILPTAGWRLPDTRGLVIADVRIEIGALALGYRPAGAAPVDSEAGARLGPRGASAASAPESLFLFDTLDRLREADERLCSGDVDGAMRLYRARLAAHLDDESLLLDRLLAIGSARRELFDECADLAVRALNRWPDFAPAHAALASIAVARGDAIGAGARYRTLSQVAAAAGEREWSARAALVAARLLRRAAPAEASGLYERVLELAPGDPEATEALVDRYGEDQRWSDLVRLLRARAEATTDPARRARDHVQAAQVLCVEVGDTGAALAEIEEAQRLDPLNPSALEVLADVQVAGGQDAAAAASLERAAALHQERRDRRGQVRALVRAAAQLERIGDQERAERLHRAVLELLPGEPAALRGASSAAARRGDHAEAVRLLRSLLAVTAAGPVDSARDSLELGRHLLAGDDPGERAAARAALERAGASGAPLVAAEAHEMMAGWARAEQRGDEAADQLGSAIEALSRAVKEDSSAPDELRARAAALAMTRAELLGELGQRDAALVDQERAFALSSEAHPLRLRAARALAGVAHARGDRDAERYWLGALLAHPALTGERAELLARRAQLAFDAGEDLTGALLDLDRALEEPLPAARAASMLRLRADVLGALGDPHGRAGSLERALEVAIHPRERAELSTAVAQALLQTGDAAAALERARDAVDALGGGEAGGAGEAGEPTASEGVAAGDRAPERVASWDRPTERVASGDPSTATGADRATAAGADRAGATGADRAGATGADRAGAGTRATADLRRAALIALGEAGWRARDWGEVERAYAELMAEPGAEKPERAYRLGTAREALGQPDAAAAAYELAIADPAAPAEMRVATWRALAALHEHSADLARAALAYESLAGDRRAGLGDAARADAWYRAGDLYRKAGGREREAERCLEAALSRVGDHMPSLDVLERLKRDEGDHERVAVILGRKIAATTRQPASQKSLLVRLAAVHEERLGQPEVARESYTRALAIDPDYRPALRFAARDARARSQVEAAVRATSRLAEVLPGDGELGGQDADQLAAERVTAAVDLAALVVAHPTAARLELGAAALRRAQAAAPDDARLAGLVAELAAASAALPPAPAAAAPASPAPPAEADPHAALVAQARAALDAGNPDAARAALEPVARDAAPDALLELRAQAAEALGDPAAAAADLDAMGAGAVRRGDAAAELRAARQRAALAARQPDGDELAAELYQRVLSLDPDDLISAEAAEQLAGRGADLDRHRTALFRVLDIARRTGAGRAREARALRDLAHAARLASDLAAAADYLDQAWAADPSATDALRERADLAAELGDAPGAAQCLERLIDQMERAERAADRPPTSSPTLGEIHLELADLYYDQIGDVARAREAMRRAASCFDRGARRDATLRLLASEAAAAGEAGPAAEALEAIAPDRLAPADRLALARCYQRLGRDQRAIVLLEAARHAGSLSDEGALLLFALHRHRKQKADLAASLERRARGAPRAVATARLREALDLHREALGDDAGIARVEAALERIEQGKPELGAGSEPGVRTIEPEPDADGLDASGGLPTVVIAESADDELDAALTLEEAGQHTEAAARYEAMWGAAPDDMRPLEALERLYLARGEADAVSEVLGRMIVATEDRPRRAALWYRRARLYRDLLHREGEAYRCLKEAFASDPDSGDIAHALRSIAMARGEWGLAAELVYREIAAAAASPDGSAERETAALYNELALIFDQKLADPEQAQRCYEHALRLDPAIPAAPRPLARLYELAGRHADAALLYERAAAHSITEVERGTLLRRAAGGAERAGRDDEAHRLLGLAALPAAEVAAALLGDGELAPIAAESPAARIQMLEAQLRQLGDLDEVSDLHRQILEIATGAGYGDTVERHAAALMAHNQADLSAYLALKSQATAQGNWRALAGLLQVRAAAVPDEQERAVLLTELGRLYDKELADLGASVAAYEAALDAVPDHPIALEALAEIAYVRGDWLRARDLYGRLDPAAVALAPDIFHYRLGEIAEILGRDEEACAAFTASVQLYPGSRQALTALSRTALRVGDLARAIDASRALLELIPLDDVRAVRAARLQLAELCGRSGDPRAAIAYYEQVLSDEPKSITALSSLLAHYTEAGDFGSAARVLRSLIALTPGPTQRAELLFRLGEMCRRGLGDPDLAADSYLKAIDLDPDHLPTLRRLLDHYWRAGDNKNLLDVARDLDKRGALLDRVVDADALAGAMLVAALRGARDLAVRVADHFGPALGKAMAAALVDASARTGGPPARDLVGAALELAARAGIDAPELGAELRRFAGDDPRAAALLAAWAAART